MADGRRTTDDVISWNEDGSSFVMWRPAEFARDLLPKHFKHNNFSIFVRQLNTFGFGILKTAPGRWEFGHGCFRRGEKPLLGDIHRQKSKSDGGGGSSGGSGPVPKQRPSPLRSFRSEMLLMLVLFVCLVSAMGKEKTRINIVVT